MRIKYLSALLPTLLTLQAIASSATGIGADMKSAEADAVRNATEQYGTAPERYRVVNTWQDSGLTHVEIDTLPAAPPSAACQDHFVRKVVVTPFRMRQPGQASDIDQLQVGVQDALVARLNGNGLLASRSGNEAPFTLDPGLSDLRQLPETVRRMARQFGSQFVVSGLIHDMGTRGERYSFSHGSGDVAPGERKRELVFPLLDFFEPGIKAGPAQRQFDVELLLFDGVSGMLIERKRFSETAHGSVMQRSGTQFGSASFWQSDYGQTVATTFDAMRDHSRGKLSCLPFSARIVRVEGQDVYIDAGGLSGIRAGDRLRHYSILPGAQPVDGLIEGDMLRLGAPEIRGGWLTVESVQPGFAIARRGNGQIMAGDYARSR
ncbi:flagella assembly protein FlgT middle domain-containing protein [Chitinibacteraceae bacterium HSL-7]